MNLAYFLEVARAGSVTEAARVLNVAPSAVSRQIAELEAGIGVPLFARQPRGMILTGAGSRDRRSAVRPAATRHDPHRRGLPGSAFRCSPGSHAA
ncbi:helix-turn-helix domain-containing protein [Streptomyces dysideae]|uniref:helix-turn-helix domain-containing protein n=1 Tax=Streptomyces dysideae TaxID=909626 RepID=UPI00389ADDAA